MGRHLTSEYIVELFEGVMDSPEDWEHNKKRFIEILDEYKAESVNAYLQEGIDECDHHLKTQSKTEKGFDFGLKVIRHKLTEMKIEINV